MLMLEDISVEDKIRTAGTSMSLHHGLDEAVDADRRALDVWIRMGAEYYRKEGGRRLPEGNHGTLASVA